MATWFPLVTPLALLGAFSRFVTARSWWRGYRQHGIVDNG
jgi:hypothetical protein